MTVTFTNFTPSVSAVPPFQFSAVFDGNTYNVSLTWLVFGQRWYFTVSDLFGNLVVYAAVIGSSVGAEIAAASWSNGFVTIETSTPHGFLVGATVEATIVNCQPDALNGTFPAYVNDRFTMTFPLPADPGPATALGSVEYNINLVTAYFETSSLVFRTANNQFEVSP
jgi:hypothetical protein